VKVSTQVKNNVLKECLSVFLFFSARNKGRINVQSVPEKTKVVTTKSTFSWQFNAPVHIENHGV
jgi:hypothetical protein